MRYLTVSSVEVALHAFLSSVLDASKWWALRLSSFIPGETPVLIEWKAGKTLETILQVLERRTNYTYSESKAACPVV